MMSSPRDTADGAALPVAEAPSSPIMLIQQSTHLPKLLEFGIRPERRRQSRERERENEVRGEEEE